MNEIDDLQNNINPDQIKIAVKGFNKKIKRKRRWILRLIIIFIILSVVSMVGKYIKTYIDAEAKIAVELKRFEDAGISLNIEDYVPEPVPDEENAAIILAEAFKKLTEDKLVYDEINKLLLKETVNEQINIELIKDYINANEECIEIVKKALKRPKCRFEVDYYANDPDLPHTKKEFDIVEILLCKAAINMRENKLDEAVDNIALSMKLSDTLIDEPALITQAIFIVANNLEMIQIKSLLTDYTLNDSQCQILLNELDKQLKFSINKSLIIEFLHIINNFKGTPRGQQGNYPWYYLPALKKTDYGVVLQRMHDEIVNQQTPSGLTKMTNAKVIKLKWDLYEYPKFALFSPAAMPIYRGIELDSAMVHAKLGVAKTALGIQIYYNRNKKLPETLDVLVEQKIIDSVPQDPFREDALTYLKIDDKTYKIYTYGENLKDDGGNPVKTEEDDYAWTITVK